MADTKMEFGIVGLGNIGGNLAAQALEKGIRVVGFDRKRPPQPLLDAGLEPVSGLGDFRQKLARPRAVFLYIPAGPAVDAVLQDLGPHLDEGDVIADGGNSYWGDSIRRQRRLRERGLRFVDLGTSGGLAGARRGACFMAGGEREAVARVEPILLALAAEGGYVHAGPPGAGHYVKLVHNGIEFGMLQAIGEGMELLERHRDPLPVAEVLRCWRHGSVIRSWLIELMEEGFRARGGLKDVPAYVEDTGEVNWLVEDALRMEVPVPVIAQSVMQLFQSRGRSKDAARAVAVMRHGFGNHPFGPDESVARKRPESRVGSFPQE
ncbi:MAG: decarboxylating 6-phosphogluconate dehydrogenase [Candidatus Tectomicrobia bacterium]|uniref:Decarboxylating 6-phosphogluconate dehydrogenase n=1 Tax=Tectimicrobiota bacterium TaxID=2528274 RepID=A0A932MN22_UNCTE|nr:decarboxylating 6-phosphogluconate dehydrogenase [Candidatus Tectomicrobia bacterium]